MTALQIYVKQLHKHLPLWFKNRKVILSTIEADLSTYSEDYPNATYEDIIEVFGTPDDMVRNYLKECSTTPSSHFEPVRSILFGVIGTIVMIFLCFSIFYIAKQRSRHYNISYTNSTLVSDIQFEEANNINLKDLTGSNFILAGNDLELVYPNTPDEPFLLVTPYYTIEITGGILVHGYRNDEQTVKKKASVSDEAGNLVFTVTQTATFSDADNSCTDVSYSYEVLDQNWKITKESCENSGTVATTTITATTYFLFLPIDSETIELKSYIKEDGLFDFMN